MYIISNPTDISDVNPILIQLCWPSFLEEAKLTVMSDISGVNSILIRLG